MQRALSLTVSHERHLLISPSWLIRTISVTLPLIPVYPALAVRESGGEKSTIAVVIILPHVNDTVWEGELDGHLHDIVLLSLRSVCRQIHLLLHILLVASTRTEMHVK